MSKQQRQHIIDIHNMACMLNIRQLKTIKELEEKMIDAHLLSLAPDAILENMDVTEKLMLIRELSLTEEERQKEREEAIPLEDILREEGLEGLLE
ncbi:MAG: hypothetical protein FWF46_06330 [Oscillospiraceae bacterium]|nr:hypothetical protein [Oscillospiraceae bacterium]